MSHQEPTSATREDATWPDSLLRDHVRLCLAVAAVSLTLSLFGAVVNYFVPGRMLARGPAVVGAFYLLLALASWRRKPVAARAEAVAPRVQLRTTGRRPSVGAASAPWELN